MRICNDFLDFADFMSDRRNRVGSIGLLASLRQRPRRAPLLFQLVVFWIGLPYENRGVGERDSEMQRTLLILSLAFVAISIHSGCCGPHWRVGLYREAVTGGGPMACTACGETSCQGDCMTCGEATWYPGKHIVRGFHHVCSLFTCYGCGGTCYGCGGYAGEGWSPSTEILGVENQLEPVPTPAKAISPTPSAPATPTESGK